MLMKTILIFLFSTLMVLVLFSRFKKSTSKIMFMKLLLMFLMWDKKNLNMTKQTLDNMSMSIDSMSMQLTFMAFFIGSCILNYSFLYLSNKEKKGLFSMFLSFFLLKMFLMMKAYSFMIFIMGWEGVGIMSFLLIGWWKNRKQALSSSVQSMIYKRMGDLGFFLGLMFFFLLKGTFDMSGLIWGNSSFYILYFFILAAMGKSAQMGLHAWLPSAMEGPTPVSALLHSSTMVVAGVYLLIRTSQCFSPLEKNFILLLGSLTSVFASILAFMQYDLKKIMAYSTTSQLGLMLFVMGLGKPELSFFHLSTHAFFKAALFLSAGYIIHKSNKKQDIRKIGKMYKTQPSVFSIFFIASLSLAGLPFLSGFYSKDLILESLNKSSLNMISLILIILATLGSVFYTLRSLEFLTGLKKKNLVKYFKEKLKLIKSFQRLMPGAMLSGWLILNNILYPYMFMLKLSLKVYPFLFLLMAFMYFNMRLKIWKNFNMMKKKLVNNQFFFINFTHNKMIFLYEKFCFWLYKRLELSFLEFLGPFYMYKSTIMIMSNFYIYSMGNYKFYLSFFLLSLISFFMLMYVSNFFCSIFIKLFFNSY